MRYRILGKSGVSVSELCLGTMNFAVPTDEAQSIRIVHHAIDAGVNFIGCSNFYAWQVMEGIAASRARNISEFACAQPMYNVVNRDAELELLPLCQKYGLGVVCYSPLARGVLTGKYRAGAPLPENSRAARGDRRIHQTELREESFKVAEALRPLAAAHDKSLSQFALAWVLANRAVTSVIIGPRSGDQLEDNLGAIGWSLNAEDEKRVDALVPRGEHTGKGYNDPQYPVRGRVLA